MENKTTDQKTIDLIKDIQKRKSELAKIERSAWRTNCSFSFVEGSNGTVNIQVLSSVSDLLKVHSFILEKAESFEKSADVLGIENLPKFQWCGFSYEDWTEDIKMRINKIQISSKRKKLEELESRLSAIISPELRASIELDAIQEELLK